MNMPPPSKRHMSRTYIPTSYTKDYDQYQNGTHSISVVGSLKKHYRYFEQLGAPEHILRIIKYGYVIPLKENVPFLFRRNNKSSRECPEFVQSSIDELLDTGAVIELPKPARVTNPLTVSQKGTKLRLVLDLRHVNLRTKQRKCKIEGASTFNKYLSNAKYMFGYDLKSGYHHIDIHKHQHELLGFSYHDYTGKVRYFQFVVLPFGLCTAGFVFTQVLRILVMAWRRQGISIVSFFDDGLAAAVDLTSAKEHSQIVFLSLIEAGFIPNYKKCQWSPVQIITWLGFIYNLITGFVSASEEKLDKCLTQIAQLQMPKRVHIKTVASFTGLLISMHNALGDIVYLKSKHTQILIASHKTDENKQDWNCHVTLNTACLNELTFWKGYLRNNNGMPLHVSVASAAVSFSDASGVGTASLVTPAPGQKELKIVKTFSEIDKGKSSTYRELMAVLHGLSETKHVLQGKNVRWLNDNQAIVSIVRKGSMKTHLLNLALQIFEICKSYDILLALTWIPRELNDRADHYSRVVDHDDWGVHPNWYSHITRILGVPTIDRFADVDNRTTAASFMNYPKEWTLSPNRGRTSLTGFVHRFTC